MIQPNSMLEALQRGLYGLGGVGTSIEDKRKADAALAQAAADKASTEAGTAGKNIANKLSEITFKNAMLERQIKDQLNASNLKSSAPDTPQMQASVPPTSGLADLGMGKSDIGSAPGLGSPTGNTEASSHHGEMSDADANLQAILYRENNKPELADPALLKARHASAITEAQNAGVLSDQSTITGQQKIDSGNIELGTSRATQAADIQDKNLAPIKTRAGIGLTIANEDQSRAAAEKDRADAGKAKALSSIEGTDTDNLAKGLVTGDVNWDEFKTVISGRGAEGSAARLSVYNKAKAMDPSFNPTEMEKSWKAYSNPNNQKAIAQIDNVKPNLDRLVQLSGQISRTGLPAVNKMILSGKYQIGDRDVTNFKEMQHALADELAAALSGTGQMTDAKLRLAQSMLQADPSDDNYASNIKLISHMLDTRKEAITKPMGVYGKRITNDTLGHNNTSSKVSDEDIIKQAMGAQ